MKKLIKIVKKRNLKERTYPLKIFEERMKDTMSLEGTLLSKKLDEKLINEVKNQMIVVMITCYESYLRDIFSIIIDEGLVPLEKLFRIKQIRDIQFNLKDVEYICQKNIKISEIICNYINFQNFNQMIQAFSIINIDKEIGRKIKNKSNVMPPPEMMMKKTSSKEEIEEIVSNHMNEFFKQFVKNKRTFNLKQLYSSLKFLLQVRHLIVHENIKFKIDQDEILHFISAIYEFVMLLDEIVQELRKKK